MSDLIIRQAEEKDIHQIAEIDKLCFSTPWSEDSFTQEITSNDIALYIVAVIDDFIVGYAGLWLIVDEGHITNVAVHPDFRRRKIAKALVQVLIDVSEKKGAVRHTLEVRTLNDAAIRLYEAFGFQEVSIRKGYYEDDNEDAIIMWRE